MANLFLEIPDSFWGLFRSRNRQVYIDALLQIQLRNTSTATII